MFISVSETRHVVLKASSSLMKHLGYPTDWWRGRQLRDFIEKRDMSSVYKCLAHNTGWGGSCETPGPNTLYTTEAPSQESSNHCFIRIRRFRRREEGINPENTKVYSPFHVTLSSNTTLTKQPDSDVHGHESQERSFTISCTPLTTNFWESGQRLHDDITLSMRHSAQCNVTFICANTVNTLGFFPQDLEGISIFDLYHHEDLPMLMYVHANVMVFGGEPFETDPMRLKTRNGHYVTVKTQWTGFINPFSRTLEFIIAQHTVMKAPYNPHLFEEPLVRLGSIFETTKGCRVQKKILDVLKQPVILLPCEDERRKKREKRKARLSGQKIFENLRHSTSTPSSETPLINSKVEISSDESKSEDCNEEGTNYMYKHPRPSSNVEHRKKVTLIFETSLWF
ncbi:circadian clock protein period [Elysia marginata]|uniref:Circadian clock protein period n=1 Tax=Elysia marginata TaxID=1093978 RepID=A0AAV4GZM1_9GAST|nr:circadian clock protein period [Elysia marginata]